METKKFRPAPGGFLLIPVLLIAGALGGTAPSPQAPASALLPVYRSLQQFELNGGSAVAENVVLHRDRAEITFNGKFYFEAPVDGRYRGAVFLGKGKVHADAPPVPFEQFNLQRMLKADAVDSDFSTAVLRFTDDTPERLGLKISAGESAPDDAKKLAAAFSPRLLREGGVDAPARMVVSMANGESPGVFLAEFDKGSRGHFYFVFDPQCRVLAQSFGIDGGEKGMFVTTDSLYLFPEIWTAFWSQEDYQQHRAKFSDSFALVAPRRYEMDIDVRDWKHMKIRVRMQLVAQSDGVRAIPLMMNESLSTWEDERLKKALRLKAAHLGAAELTAVQQDWSGTVTLLLPEPLAKGQVIEPTLEFEGEFLLDPISGANLYYVRGDCWYPRHVQLERAQFDMTFWHKKGTRVVSVGQKIREENAPDGGMVTEWRMGFPISFVTFAAGPFDVHGEQVSLPNGAPVPLEFYSWGGIVKTDFVLAELGNTVRYFSALFGSYPYQRLGAVFHPFPFGQGFATLLRLPRADENNEEVFRFLAHETSHQWWGNVVAWRSYRDQWLSEGFAEYSGILFAERRDTDKGTLKLLLRRDHEMLYRPPRTRSGIGKGQLADVGPIILGFRLNGRESFGAYQALVYSKGALVLRMLHFLLSNQSTGSGDAFFGMMQDFARRYTNRAASTEDFAAVAGEHFARSPIGQKYKIQNLDWFFRQWVYEVGLPSYSMRYSIDQQPDGSSLIHGTVTQKGVPNDWVMPLPVTLEFSGGQNARGTILASGPEAPFSFKVPGVPSKVELDPDQWVLSRDTSAVKAK